MPGKLKKLSMPKREEVDISELEMEAPAEDMAGMEESDMGEAPTKESPLASISDDDLLAEMKKRGLMGALKESSPEEMSRDEMLGAGEEEDEMSEYA
jgi:hypothetical protein